MAVTIIEKERARNAFLRPPLRTAIVVWRDRMYIGGIQHVIEEDREIVFLTKSSKPIEPELAISLLELDPTRLHLRCQNSVEIDGRMHVLRLVGEELMRMTPKQMVVAANIMEQTKIFEIYP